MSFLKELYENNRPLATVLNNEGWGIRQLLEELIYPDRAHFIFELLQNAEDTGATEVSFNLNDEGLIFEHNGEAFTRHDVKAITNVAMGTKKENEIKIGKFGIGFKAVFAYTNSPKVYSKDFNFKITDMVLPEDLGECDLDPGITRFVLPFNNPDKKTEVALKEIQKGLVDLDETSILFLSNIKTINITLPDIEDRGIILKEHSNNLVSINQDSDGATLSRLYYLRYKKKSLTKQVFMFQ